MPRIQALWFILALTLLGALNNCTPAPPADYYELDGILLIGTDSATDSPNWKSVHYLNSKGIQSEIAYPDSSHSTEYEFYLNNPGSYSFWLLTTSSGKPAEENFIDVTITGPDNFLVDRFRVALPEDDERLQWVRTSAESDSPLSVNFEQSGYHTISLNSRGIEGLQAHKIHMAFNNYIRPVGQGLPPSTHPEINSADQFREIPIMLPPVWFFGVNFATVAPNRDGTFADELYEKSGIEPDALWFDADTLDEIPLLQNSGPAVGEERMATGLTMGELTPADSAKVRELYREILDSGFDFTGFRRDVPHSFYEEIFQYQFILNPQQERGFLISDFREHFSPEMKQFPSPSIPPFLFEWSAPVRIQQDTFSPGGFSEQVQALSKMELSTYNVPFMIAPIDFSSANPDAFDGELFQRAVQFSAFSPSMVLYGLSSELLDSLSSDQLETLHRYAELRQALFPYINSEAHFTRQTGQGIIRGFRDREDQFRFGDAILVAPVTEPGIRERTVYFPGEGYWYDYHTGRRYEAGQSWVVESPVHRVPLFIKAGSVIPFRIEPGPVRSGSNENLRVEIYTGDAGTFRLVEDDGKTRDYRRAIAARTMFRYNEVAGEKRLTIGAVQRGYEGMADQRSLDLHFKYLNRPAEVRIDGENIESGTEGETRTWSYDEASRELIIYLREESKHQRTEIAIVP